MNTRCAPDRIRLLHLGNELPDFSGQTRLSGLASALPTFAAPVAPESVAMPAHDGLGLDDNHSRTPIHPTARQPNQDHAIALAQARPFSAAFVCGKLPAQREVFEDQTPVTRESQVEQPKKRRNLHNHCSQGARTANSAVKWECAQAPQSKRLRSFGEPQSFGGSYFSTSLRGRLNCCRQHQNA